MPLDLDDAFPSEEALRGMVRRRKLCFDHDPFYVRDGTGQTIQIGFRLNLYAAFQDPRHLPFGSDEEYHQIVSDLRGLCRVFFQSLDILKPCEHPEPPIHRIVYSPERRHRAEVCLEIPIFDQERFGAKPGRHLKELLATAECLLRSLGARAGRWDEDTGSTPPVPGACEDRAKAAKDARNSTE